MVADFKNLIKFSEGKTSIIYYSNDNPEILYKTGAIEYKGILKSQYHILKDLNSKFYPIVYDWFEDDKHCGYTIERIRYPDINKWAMNVNESERLKLIKIVLINILEGLNILHKKGIVHGDLKPSHIFVGDDLNIKIIDPSIDNELITPEYAAPEVFSGEIDFSSDIYSLGLIFYEVLTSDYSFKDIRERNKRKITLKNYLVPKEIKNVINKMVESDRNKRYKDIDSIISDLLNLSMTIEPKFINHFVGRQKEIDFFKNVLSEEENFLFFVSGPRGIGKTTLMKRLDVIAKEMGFHTGFINDIDEIDLKDSKIIFIDEVNIDDIKEYLKIKSDCLKLNRVSLVISSLEELKISSEIKAYYFNLQPLSTEEIKSIISYSFKDISGLHEISEFILNMSGGIPFYTNSILNFLCDNKYIYFENNSWNAIIPYELRYDIISDLRRTFEEEAIYLLKCLSCFEDYMPYNIVELISKDYIVILKKLVSFNYIYISKNKIRFRSGLIKEEIIRITEEEIKKLVSDTVLKNKELLPPEIVFDFAMKNYDYNTARKTLLIMIKRNIMNEKLSIIKKIKNYLSVKDDLVLKILLGFLQERTGINQDAIKTYQEIIKNLVKNDYFIFRIGVNKRKIGDLKDARAIFEELLIKDAPFKQRLMYEYGRILISEKRYNDVLSIINNLSGKIPEIRFLEAIIYFEKNEYKKSLEILDEFLSEIIDESLEGAIYSLKGNIYHKLKDYQTAIKEYEKGLEIYKKLQDRMNEAINRFNLGNVYMCIDSYDRAIEEIEKAYLIVKGSNNKQLEKKYILLLSTLYLRKGNLKYAMDILNKFCEKYNFKDIDIIKKEFYLSLFTGNFLNAESLINEITDEERNALKGYLSFFKCEFDKAIECFNNVIRKKDDREILMMLSLCYFFNDRFTKSKNIVDKIKKEETGSLFEKAQFYMIYGLYERDYLKKAKELLKEIGAYIILGECEMLEGYLLIKENKIKEGFELILKSQETFRKNYAYGYLYWSISITNSLIKTLNKNNLYNEIVRMLENLLSLIDKNDLYGFIEIIKNFFGAERGAIILKKDRVYGKDMDEITLNDLNEISKSAIKLAEKGEILLSYNAGEDERFMDKRSVFLNKIKSILCVPIFSRDKIKGILYLDSTINKNLFTEEDKDFLLTIGRFLGILLDKGEVYLNLKDKVEKFDRFMSTDFSFYGMVGISRSMKNIFEKVREIAQLEMNVLITGETGTGKNMLAEIIHKLSKRKNEKFVVVECTTIPHELFESELFGHIKGSFTGATSDKIGLCETANRGTLFLDEIGDIPLNIQSKLLRLIEQGEIRSVGDVKWKKVDTRIICATNKELESAVTFKEFRADLYYRLKQVEIHIPPLRERIEDIPLIIEERIKIINEKFGKKIKGVKEDCLKLLSEYPFPGNVRELINIIDSICAIKRAGYIEIEDIIDRPELNIYIKNGLDIKKQNIEKRIKIIINTLQKTGWNYKKTAEIINISERHLFRLLKKYNIKKQK